jgi:choline kinase
VDHDVNGVFDLDDATKVELRDTALVDIGKQLTHYHAVDTGLFAVGPALVSALHAFEAPQLSDGVRSLAKQGRMWVCDVTGSRWIDVDTPSARSESERMLLRFGADLGSAWVPGCPTSPSVA